MKPGRPLRSEGAANLAMLASCATIGAHALKPAPVRARKTPHTSTRPGLLARLIRVFLFR